MAITYSSVPEYGVFSSWSCQDWINWHIALKKQYGQNYADQTWGEAWLKGVSKLGGGKSDNYVLDTVPLECRSFNDTFRAYINKNENSYIKGIVYNGIAGLIAKPIGAATDVVTGATDIVTDTAKGAAKAFDILKKLIPLLLIIATIIIIILALKYSGITWSDVKKIGK